MPFDDLDLEFEDEDEAKKKKSEAVHVDVDLDFAVPEGAKPRPTQAPKPVAPTGVAPSAPKSPARPAEVRNIGDARAAQAQPVKRPAPLPQSGGTQPRVAGTSALKEETHYDVDSQQVVEMRAEMQRIQLEADVKVQVAEFKTEYLTEMLSDMKLASHQIEQLLVRINAKHPDMKNEVLMIKKILADFVSKKRK